MPDGTQLEMLDLLTAPTLQFSAQTRQDASPAPQVGRPPLLPSRSYWWDEAIADSEAALNVRLHVSEHWTGIVVEQINDPVLGRRILWHNGTVTRYPYTASCIPSRTIFMTAEGVEKLGRLWSVLDRGEGYIRYCLAPKRHDDGP